MLITVSQIMQESFTLYRQNVKEIFKYLGLTFAVSIIPFAAIGFAIPFFSQTLSGPISAIAIIVTVIVFLALLLIAGITLMRVLKKMYTNEPRETVFRECMAAKSRLIPMLASSLLLLLMVVGGGLLLIIPGIIFAIWFYFAPYACIFDNEKIIAGFKKSKALVKGRAGQVLWRIMAPGFVYAFIYLVANWIIMTPGQYFLASTGSQIGAWMTSVLGILFYFLFVPLSNLIPVIVYENLKRTPLAQSHSEKN